MKRLFIILFLIPLFCFSQDSPKSKYTFGFFLAPCYSYRIIPSKLYNIELINERNKRDEPAFGFSTGFMYKRINNKHFNFSYGIMLSEYSFNVKKSVLNYGSEIDNIYGIGITSIYAPFSPHDTTLPTYYSKRNHYFCLSIPVLLSYKCLLQKKLSVSAGFTPVNIYIGNENRFTLYYNGGEILIDKDPSRNSTVSQRRIVFSYLFSIAYETKILHEQSISFGLFYQSMFSTYLAHCKLYQLGLTCSLFF
jgi:hypothetical protein